MSEHIHHHHHGEINQKSVKLLLLSFTVNILLSLAEVISGIISGSVALIGDALHNTSDAFSILIAVIAFKIGNKKATGKYTYGFKRAEAFSFLENSLPDTKNQLGKQAYLGRILRKMAADELLKTDGRYWFITEKGEKNL